MAVFLAQQSICSGTKCKAQLNALSGSASGWKRNICELTIKKKKGKKKELNKFA